MEYIEPFEHDWFNIHRSHSVIVEVNTPFTLCGYLLITGGVVRQPLYHDLPKPFFGMLCTRPKSIPLLLQP